MEPWSSLPPDLVRLLERGGTVLTGNQRAARTLRLAYDRQRRASGIASWQPPAIFAWETWTANLWHEALLEGTANRMLLNRTQELHLWRSVIASDSRHSSLRTIDSLADLASSAWQLLCAYRGQSRLRDLGVSEDTRTFQRWTQAFILRAKSDAYLSPSELESALAALARHLPLGEILLTGFDRTTPAQAAFIEALRAAGCVLSELSLPNAADRILLAACETPDEELADMAHRIRELLEANPTARVAIIHPDIASERGEIDRVLRHVLAPELDSIATQSVGHSTGPYEFSLGQPLAQAPMVASALHLLHLAIGPLDIDDLSGLLLSPWFAPASEIDLRAEFDAREIRTATMLHPRLGLNGLIRIAESSRTRSARLGNLLRQLHGLQRTTERILPEDAKQRPFAEWADSIRELLRAAAWASFTRDTSVEFQTRRKWESALDELATRDFEGIRPTFAEALQSFEAILARTLFAPESRDAPVQIMSPQEAAGSRFDAIFFPRCSDLAWPAPTATNPLLGWRLQRDLRMPGSDPALDTAYAQAITRRIAASAPTVVFSYAYQTLDAHQRPSPLISGLPIQLAEPLGVAEPLSPISLEEITDPGLIPLANPKVRGGSAILKNQAACAFRAFAEARLASRPLDAPAAGLDASERGSIVHATMAHLWDDLRSQAALRALTSEQRHAALDRAITRALERAASHTSPAVSAWDTAYLAVQRERLHRIILPWLDDELLRAPFTIKSLEQKFEDLTFGPLRLDLRVDRIDTVLDENGEPAGEILLDYKTGDATPKDWQGERPDDPQLPLYAALAEPGTLAGLGFIRLRPGSDRGLIGCGAEDGILTKQVRFEAASLDAQIEEWRRVLVTLAEDFAAGNASVYPKDYPKTCAYCAQRLLCRVDPASFEAPDSATDEDEASEGAKTHEEGYG